MLKHFERIGGMVAGSMINRRMRVLVDAINDLSEELAALKSAGATVTTSETIAEITETVIETESKEETPKKRGRPAKKDAE